MAICNLFRQLSKETGNFLLFDQYSDDLTRCFVQHDSYVVTPSKFIALDIDYNYLPANVRQSQDMNEALPTYLQNFYENGCAWLKSSSILNRDSETIKWDVSKWTPGISTNIFWNSLIQNGLLHVNKYDKYWQGTHQTGELESFDVIDEIRYIGNIDIHSYEEKDGVGYSEIYCYIPNGAGRTLYKVVDILPSQTPAGVAYPDDEQHKYCVGCSAETENILGVLPVGIHAGEHKVNPVYYYDRKYKFYGNREMSDSYIYTDEANMRDYNKYRELSGETTEDFFKFNTIIVLYDVIVKDKQGNVSTLYQDIPMGMYFTGKWDKSAGKISNEVVKYSTCEDAYKSGTSYGLRICTRYMCTPNSTTISSVELDPADQYAGFSMAMDEMAKSQQKMEDMIEEVYSKSQNMKEAIMSFKNSKTNCPYIRQLGNDFYWFINGRNTGVFANGNPGKDGRNGTILELVEMNGTYYWALDGIITNVRAEGIDGSPGLKGDTGDPGKDGHSPIITIRQTKDPSKTSEYLTWFVDGVDTGVLAQGTNGINGKPGKDGLVPSIVQARDGKKYWYIGNVTTGVRAEGKDGQSIFVLNGVVGGQDVYVINNKVILHNTTSDDWKEKDIILYIGSSVTTGYNMNPYDLYKILGYNYSHGGWEIQFLGNIAGSVEGGVTNFGIKTAGNTTRVSIEENGTTKTFDIYKKTNKVSHSTIQRRFNHMHDTIYCCGCPEKREEVFLEIPYNVHFVKSNNNLWDVEISVDSQYSGFSGIIKTDNTKIYIKDKDYDVLLIDFGDGNYIEYDPAVHGPIKGSLIKKLYIDNGSSIEPAYLKFQRGGSSRIVNYNTIIQPNAHTRCITTSNVKLVATNSPQRYLIWKNLTQEEKQALSHSFKISKHIGKVHAYIDLYEVYLKGPNIDKTRLERGIYKLDPNMQIQNPCDISSEGILSFSPIENKWVCQRTNQPVNVAKFNKTVNKFTHTNDNPDPKDIKNIFDLLSVYSPDDIMVYKNQSKYKSTGPIKVRGIRKYRWANNKFRHFNDAYLHLRHKWIKHSPLSNISLYNGREYHGDIWKWFAMNEFAKLILDSPHNTRLGNIPFITSDNVKEGVMDRYSFSGASGATRPPHTLKTRYIYIACGKPHSKKDIYKISLKWNKNTNYVNTHNMMSPGDVQRMHPDEYILYNEDFDPTTTVMRLGDVFQSTMLPSKGVLGWVCNFKVVKANEGVSVQSNIKYNDVNLNRDYKATLLCEYVKSVNDIENLDKVIYDLTYRLGEVGSPDICEVKDTVDAHTHNIRILKGGRPHKSNMHETVYSTYIYSGDKLWKSNVARTADSDKITDIWGRTICWQGNDSISYSTANYGCMKKPLNRLVYLNLGSNIIAPIVNVSVKQLANTSQSLDSAKMLDVENGEIVAVPVNLSRGEFFPCDENGSRLSIGTVADGTWDIETSLYEPNPL